MTDLRSIARTPILAETPMAKYRTDVRRVQHGAVVLIAAAGGNLVWVGDATSPERVFALAAATFGHGAAFAVELEAETAGELEAHLRRAGWTLVEEEPALVLTPLPVHLPPPPPGLTVHRVETAADLAAFEYVRATARGIAEAETALPAAALRDPDVHLLLGSVNGRPVATARAILAGGVVDITSVVTLPEQRRRGYGRAMTWAAVAAGTTRGCTAATLTATPMGYPLYLSMGFVPVSVFRGFAPPA